MVSITVKSLNLKSAIRRVTETGNPSPVRARHLQQRVQPPITRPNHHGGLTPTWAAGRAHLESFSPSSESAEPGHSPSASGVNLSGALRRGELAAPVSTAGVFVVHLLRAKAEPHTGTPQVGWDARESPSRKTCPVKIPAWVPYTGRRADACGLLPQPGEGSSASPSLYRWLETGSSNTVTEARP